MNREIKNFLLWMRKHCTYIQSNIVSYRELWYFIDDTEADGQVLSVDDLLTAYYNS